MNASRNPRRTLLRAILVAGLVLGTAAAASAPALARGRDRDRGRTRVERHGPSHAPRVHRHVPRPAPRFDRFVVPRRIARREFRDFAVYYSGRSWYAPHRHAHRVYYFPVRFRGAWVYEPHFYCGDDLYYDRGYRYRDDHGRVYVGGHIDIGGPRFRVRVGF